MKKTLFSIAIVALTVIAMASCDSKSGNGAAKASFPTDTVAFTNYNWFDWKATVPQGKGYAFMESLPDAVKDLQRSSVISYLVGDKLIVGICDFDTLSTASYKENVKNGKYYVKIEDLEDSKIAGRNAIRKKIIESDGQNTKHFGYEYMADIPEFENYKSFSFIVYPADGQPGKIDEVLKDEEVSFILDNMTVTPKAEE